MSADIEVRERLARIEGILSQMDKRLNHVETEIQRLHQRMDRLEGRLSMFEGHVDRLRESITARIDRLFKWMVTLLASMWVTVIASLLPLILKLLALL